MLHNVLDDFKNPSSVDQKKISIKKTKCHLKIYIRSQFVCEIRIRLSLNPPNQILESVLAIQILVFFLYYMIIAVHLFHFCSNQNKIVLIQEHLFSYIL